MKKLKTLMFFLFNIADIGFSFRGASFYKVDDPNATLWTSSTTLTTYHPIDSITDCARRCLEHEICNVVTFEQNNRTCTLGECSITQPLERRLSVDLYQTAPPYCNSTPGFNITNYGNNAACLWWSDSVKNFTDAMKDCEAKGSILATFQSYEKFSIVNQTKYTRVYIGLDDMVDEFHFKWHDDGSIILGNSSYARQIFRAGEPNNQLTVNKMDEDCVAFWDNGLNDYPCSDPYNYICEKKCFSI